MSKSLSLFSLAFSIAASRVFESLASFCAEFGRLAEDRLDEVDGGWLSGVVMSEFEKLARVSNSGCGLNDVLPALRRFLMFSEGLLRIPFDFVLSSGGGLMGSSLMESVRVDSEPVDSGFGSWEPVRFKSDKEGRFGKRGTRFFLGEMISEDF